MSGNGEDQDTPVARPCLNPENRGLAEEISHLRYQVQGFGQRLGDIERTLRLALNKYGPEMPERIADVVEDAGRDFMLNAANIRRAK